MLHPYTPFPNLRSQREALPASQNLNAVNFTTLHTLVHHRVSW